MIWMFLRRFNIIEKSNQKDFTLALVKLQFSISHVGDTKMTFPIMLHM